MAIVEEYVEVKIMEFNLRGEATICEGFVTHEYKNGSFRAMWFSNVWRRWEKGFFKGRIWKDTGAFYG